MRDYNWKKYKILAEGNFSPEDITIHLSEEKRETNEFIEKSITGFTNDIIKSRIRAHKPYDYYIDNEVYRLNDLQESKSKLSLTLGTCQFREIQGTNATHHIFGDIYGKDFLANPILVQAVVYTSDNKIVLGSRLTDAKKEYEELAIFGGTADLKQGKINNSSDLFTKIHLELHEELGIYIEDIESTSLKIIAEDWKYYPVFYFEVKLKISSEEISNRFNSLAQDEHSEVIIIKEDELSSELLRTPEKYTDLTLLAFKLLEIF